jgi:hypothetical protein
MNMRWSVALAAAALMISCTSSSPVAVSSPAAPSSASASPSAPSPTTSPPAVASPTPDLRTQPIIIDPAIPIGKPVSRQVLAPATTLPIARLCQYRVTYTADGNFLPVVCWGGAVNVLAWRIYVRIGPHVMSLSRSATVLEVEKAMCRDRKYTHATLLESEYAYGISSAYYGWKFGAAPVTFMYRPYDPNHPAC